MVYGVLTFVLYSKGFSSLTLSRFLLSACGCDVIGEDSLDISCICLSAFNVVIWCSEKLEYSGLSERSSSF